MSRNLEIGYQNDFFFSVIQWVVLHNDITETPAKYYIDLGTLSDKRVIQHENLCWHISNITYHSTLILYRRSLDTFYMNRGFGFCTYLTGDLAYRYVSHIIRYAEEKQRQWKPKIFILVWINVIMFSLNMC